jgi:hypothetical protein
MSVSEVMIAKAMNVEETARRSREKKLSRAHLLTTTATRGRLTA